MGHPLCHQISSPTLFCSPLPVSCPCPTRNMALSWWPTGMNPLELPALSLILYASICFPSCFNAEGVLPPVQSSHFPVCLDLALLFLVLLCWSSCYYPGSPLPPPFLLGELLICVAHKSPCLGEVPLLCTLTASPALLQQALFSQWP